MKKKVFIALRMAGIAGQSKLAGIFRYLTERYGETHPWNIELVRSRLEVTQENINSDCGFSNPNYLKNLFKKRYSMTMSEFRHVISFQLHNRVWPHDGVLGDNIRKTTFFKVCV